MNTVVVLLQFIVAMAIINVWVVRYGDATSWRGGTATNMREEFAVYGLPSWFMLAIGSLKLLFAALLVAGVWMPELTKPAATGMAALMLGAIMMHVKVSDPVHKSVPAFIILLLCLLITVS